MREFLAGWWAAPALCELMTNSRRDFVKVAAATGLAAPAALGAAEVPKRTLGKTGLRVSIMGLGGARTGTMEDPKAAAAVIRHCYEMGVNYFDSAAAGAYGLSQSRIGAALKDVRTKLVFSTKTQHRDATQSQLDLDQSLANFKTDYIDLYQVHNVITSRTLNLFLANAG